MAHYALIKNNKVQQVITGIDEDQTDTLPEGISSWEEFYGNRHGLTCKRTSYWTKGNQHWERNAEDELVLSSTQDKALRGNYAGVGMTYDADNDVFYLSPDQLQEGWIIDTTDWNAKPPIEMPSLTDEQVADGYFYSWDQVKYQLDNADPKTQGWVLYQKITE